MTRVDVVAVPSFGDRISRRLGLGLSRELWLVQIGILLNALGWGAVLPFEVIYLHEGRGFSLETAGVVVGGRAPAAVGPTARPGAAVHRSSARAGGDGAGSPSGGGMRGSASHTSRQPHSPRPRSEGSGMARCFRPSRR